MFFFALFQKILRLEKNNMKEIIDHEGRIFKSIVELCEFHNIGYRVFLRRLERGLSMEEALTLPVVERQKYAKMSDAEYAKEYRERNRDKILAYQAEYREKNREKLAENREKKRIEDRKNGKKKATKKESKEMDTLTTWLEAKALIDSVSTAQDFVYKNFEQVLCDVADVKLMRAISNSSYLWQRANNYFICKQREKVRDNFFENNEE